MAFGLAICSGAGFITRISPKQKAPPDRSDGAFCLALVVGLDLEAHAAAHAAHATHVGHCRSAGCLIFRSVGDRRFGGDQ